MLLAPQPAILFAFVITSKISHFAFTVVLSLKKKAQVNREWNDLCAR